MGFGLRCAQPSAKRLLFSLSEMPWLEATAFPSRPPRSVHSRQHKFRDCHTGSPAFQRPTKCPADFFAQSSKIGNGVARCHGISVRTSSGFTTDSNNSITSRPSPGGPGGLVKVTSEISARTSLSVFVRPSPTDQPCLFPLFTAQLAVPIKPKYGVQP